MTELNRTIAEIERILDDLDREHLLTSAADRARSGRFRIELDQALLHNTVHPLPPSTAARYARPWVPPRAEPQQKRLPRHFDDGERQAIRDLHWAGESISAIARRFGASRALVGSVLRGIGRYA